MKFIKNTGFAILLSGLSLFLLSWGYTGHYKINYNAELSFNQAMTQFYQWTPILADHASDADERKQWDPTEAPKHYIDIDNYPEFVATGTIPQDFDEIVSIHGLSFVMDQGILPWATVTAFDSLQSCFERGDWDKAVLFASDLGHYIADGHMPMHITKNYNGQLTGNNGIHSRYESNMINMYESQITYPGEPIDVIGDVNGYVFNYLYNNYQYVDSVLAADDYAEAQAGNTSSNYYYEKLWEQSGGFTTQLFQAASHRLTELIYSAWINAGSPMITGDFSPGILASAQIIQITPNPVSGIAHISLKLKETTHIELELLNSQGNKEIAIWSGMAQPDNDRIQLNTSQFSPGLYYVIARTKDKSQLNKLIITR